MMKRLPKHKYGISTEDHRMPHLTYVPAEVEEVNTHR